MRKLEEVYLSKKKGLLPFKSKKWYLKSYLEYIEEAVEEIRPTLKPNIGFKVGIGKDKGKGKYMIQVQVIGYILTPKERWFKAILKEVKNEVYFEYEKDEEIISKIKEEVKELLLENNDNGQK